MVPPTLELEIVPYESVGLIRFGMSSLEVRQELRGHALTREEAGTDSFVDLGIRIHYGANGGAEAVEMCKPAQPTFEGRPLLGVASGVLEAWFGGLDDRIKLEHSGFTSSEFGIRAYAASARRHPNAAVEVVTVFARDFFRQFLLSVVPPAR